MSPDNTPAVADPAAPPANPSGAVRDLARRMGQDEMAIQIRAAQLCVKNAAWGTGIDPEMIAVQERELAKLGMSFTLGHAHILGGNLYISLPGRLAYAHASGLFQGFKLDSPLPPAEWAAWGVPDDAICAWVTEVERSDMRYGFKEVGFAGGSRDAKQPVARDHPGAMSRKRARARALSMAFPVGQGTCDDDGTVIEGDWKLSEPAKAIEAPRRKSALPPPEAALPSETPAPPPAPAQEAPPPPAPAAPGHQTRAEVIKGITSKHVDGKEIFRIDCESKIAYQTISNRLAATARDYIGLPLILTFSETAKGGFKLESVSTPPPAAAHETEGAKMDARAKAVMRPDEIEEYLIELGGDLSRWETEVSKREAEKAPAPTPDQKDTPTQ